MKIHNISVKQLLSTVSFKCKYHTKFLSSLYVVGNLKLLGEWMPNNALQLSTTIGTYPIWIKNKAFSCPVGTEIYYKYIIKDEYGNITWEINENRRKIISKPGDFIIEDEENKIGPDIDLTEKYDVFIRDIIPKVKKENKIKKKKSYCNLKNTSSKNNEGNEVIKVDLDKSNSNSNIRKKSETFEEINSLYDYDINIISKRNSFLFDTSLQISNKKIDEKDRIVLVNDFLPFIVKRNVNYHEEIKNDKYILLPDDTYLSIMNFVNKIKCKICWIGMLKNSEEFEEIQFKEVCKFLEAKFIYLVPIGKKLCKDYFIYYNNILLPTFINNTISYDINYISNYNDFFQAFQNVNNIFTEILYNFLNINDLIMINNMNLCLIPKYLILKNKSKWRIGIYIHLFFPSSDIFMNFPNSHEIIKSLMLSDIIGFHNYRDASNFQSVLERVFKIHTTIEKGYITFDYLDKSKFIIIKNCGINDYAFNIIKSHINNDDNKLTKKNNNYILNQEKYKKIIKDKLSIISVDNAIEINELIIKLNCYKNYLEKNKFHHGKIILIEILIYNYSNKENLEIINEKINEIKKLYGEDYVYYEKFNEEEKNISLEELLVIFSLGNVLLLLQKWNPICSLIDYYLLLQNENKIFAVIVNENNPIYPKLYSVYKINPLDTSKILKYINFILDIDISKRKKNLEHDLLYISHHTKFHFLKSFYEDLKLKTWNKKDDFAFEIKKDFTSLNFNILESIYNNSKLRLFLFDYENTLEYIFEEDNDNIKNENKLNNHITNNKIINLLKNLSNEQKNYVYILSKKQKLFLISKFKDFQNLGLAAEYGYFFKEAHDPDGNFNTFLNVDDLDWKEKLSPIIKQFELKTEGSKTEINDSFIIWNFKNSETYLTHKKANNLTKFLKKYQYLEIINEKDYLEIKPKNLNKGYFTHFVLKKLINEGKKPDFIFACGNDNSDEEMFKYLNYLNNKVSQYKENIKIITSTFSKKPSYANYYFSMENLLEYLTFIRKEI